MGLLGTSFRIARVGAGTALLGGEAALGAGRAITGTLSGVVTGVTAAAAAGAEAAARTAAGVVVEALGGPSARRSSSRGANRWVEVRGLAGEDGGRVSAQVLAALRATAGVDTAVLNVATARAVVTVSEPGPTAAQLCRVVAEAEAQDHRCGRSTPVTLPGDDELLAARLIAAVVAAAGLGAATIAAALRLGRLSRAWSAPIVLADNTAWVRRGIQRHLGAEATDVAFALLNSTTGVLTASPAGLLTEAATRAMLAVEAINGRRSWQGLEPALTQQAFASSGAFGGGPRDGGLVGAGGAGERYAGRAAAVGLGAAAVLGVASADTDTAGAAVLVAAARPVRSTSESFGCALGRGLATRHGALVMRPAALRVLDRVDTVVIDPRVLYTEELTVTQVQGVTNSRRAAAWEAARAALHEGKLTPGWHNLSTIPAAGRAGKALVSPVRDPLASAVVTEARRAGARVISLDDDGLDSLGQGFDELQPTRSAVDQALAHAVDALRADGANVALLTLAGGPAVLRADVTVGVWRNGSPPPWGADILLPDLAGMWRLLHALPAARQAAAKGIELSASGSVIGAMMLIPGIIGSGPASVNLAALAALWTGYRIGAGVFGERVPHPEPGHEWHALPVDEVRRLLPRRQPDEPSPGRLATLAAVGPLNRMTAAVAGSWRDVSDFVGALREDLADPITPVLATGAAASALLGSPLDAAMVIGVLLVNTAIAAEQTLYAQRVLGPLLAVQEPLARRLTGAVGDGRHEDVPAGQLRPGDLIEVRSAEVIPADARIILADAVEADESALTGESLPVAKTTDATPGAPLAERTSMLYAGTILVAGRATAVVTTAGPGTQMNRTSAMTARKARKVGLQAQLAHISGRALPWSLVGGGVVGLLSVLRRTPLRESVASGVAIAVAAVPEGLPLVATLAQSAAARRLSSSAVLIRNPRAIEAFARLDVVCFDKTGTLSENRLRVTSVRPVAGVDSRRVLAAAVHTVRLTAGQRFDHATDEAVQVAAADVDVQPGRTDARLPFQSDRPFAAALIGTRLSVKGAPEAVTTALAGGPVALNPLIDEMTANGWRVLAVAERELIPDQAAAAAANPVIMAKLCAAELTPLGVIGIADTPRPSARPLLEELQSRDVGVRLITGDHPVTAKVVANQLGLSVTAEQVMTGSEWERLTTDGRADAVRKYQVFARMAPEHKVQVVQALEAADLVTAMVGDGANDAAAIRAATVGVGVVSVGSDPARTAADVMLLDGKLGALVDALDAGEQLWRQVQSAVSMLVGHNIGEVSFALITSLLTGRSAINARQILLINMLTDALPAAALAVSPQTGNSIPERDEAALWRATGIRGVSAATGATLAWLFGRATGTPRRAATMAIIGLVLTQMTQILTDSHGRLVVLTAAGTLVVMAALISTPGISQTFGCTPVGPIGWGQAAAAAAIAGAISTLAPTALDRVASWAQARVGGLVVDDQDAGAHQQGVDLLNWWRQQPRAGADQRIGANRASHIRHVGKANRLMGPESTVRGQRWSETLESVRSFVASHQDTSKLVREAERFSIRLPVIGRVSVPPPDELALYGALAILAATRLIDWPVAAAIGVAHPVTTRHIADHAKAEEPAHDTTPRRKPAKAAQAARARQSPDNAGN